MDRIPLEKRLGEVCSDIPAIAAVSMKHFFVGASLVAKSSYPYYYYLTEFRYRSKSCEENANSVAENECPVLHRIINMFASYSKDSEIADYGYRMLYLLLVETFNEINKTIESEAIPQ